MATKAITAITCMRRRIFFLSLWMASHKASLLPISSRAMACMASVISSVLTPFSAIVLVSPSYIYVIALLPAKLRNFVLKVCFSVIKSHKYRRFSGFCVIFFRFSLFYSDFLLTFAIAKQSRVESSVGGERRPSNDSGHFLCPYFRDLPEVSLHHRRWHPSRYKSTD